jgi:hypothetical protein
MTEQAIEDFSRYKVIGWASEYGYQLDPSYMSDKTCPECEGKQ